MGNTGTKKKICFYFKVQYLSLPHSVRLSPPGGANVEQEHSTNASLKKKKKKIQKEKQRERKTKATWTLKKEN